MHPQVFTGEAHANFPEKTSGGKKNAFFTFFETLKKKSIFGEIVNSDFGAPGLLTGQFFATAKKWRKFPSIWGVCGYLGGRGPARGHLNFDLPPGLARFDQNPQGQLWGAAGVRASTPRRAGILAYFFENVFGAVVI